MSSRYFENLDCEFYPCHSLERMNCLFCFCPLYRLEDCGGNPSYIMTVEGRKIKDCSDCVFPHIEENYARVIERLESE